MTQKEPRITYLLGAGASYHALPIVQEIQNEAFVMLHYVERYAKHHKKSKAAFEKTRELILSIGSHYSVDTLARKYFLKNNGDFTIQEYQRLKNIITCLIIFCQIEKWSTSSNIDVPEVLSGKRRKVFKLDPRYDAFFAAILNDDFSIPQQFNFISWNYDFQLEKAFKFYYPNHSIWGIGSNEVLKIDYNVADSGFSQIFKVNGTSVFVDGLNGKSGYDVDYYIYDDELHSIFERALCDDYDNNLWSGIKFAWEPSVLAARKREQGSTVIQNSDFVVVIGYSFPLFNRKVDIDMFKHFNGRIIIQDIPERANEIQNQLDAIKPGLKERSSIITNVENFYIPSEYWTGIRPLPSTKPFDF
jgi:hypothetical protein